MAASSSSSPSASHKDPDPADSHKEDQDIGPYGYGGYPLYAPATNETTSTRLPAYGSALQPGLYTPSPRKIGNPVPLGLSGFALTTFLLSCVNLGVINEPYIVVAPSYAYGGLVQLLAGMWEFALGNTFGATALSSYGGFWISIGIILQPGGGFQIAQSYTGTDFDTAFGLYIFGWFIFTFMLWLMTLRSTVFFSSLFGTVWIAFICLGAAYLDAANNETGAPNVPLTRAGGAFGMIAAFIAWYLCLAGLLDDGNSFFTIPVFHFPWSEKGRESRNKKREAKEENGHNV
ncbi:hypothetical protein MBLNU230_g0719t1 [Neophaeotheca triangularis]